jgi:aromatic-L-amino-acid decarboxylase
VTPEEFRRQGHALVERIADYRLSMEARRVAPTTRPGEVLASLPASPPTEAEPFAAILADVEGLIAPHLLHWQHPSFFGYFPANADLSSVLADLISTGMGPLGLAWASSPALTELEQVVTDWMRQMLSLDEGWHGVIQDTASSSTFVAMVSARERTTGYSIARSGLQDGGAPLVVYASREVHSSVEKAVGLAGFGRDHLRLIETDDDQAMRADRLATAIEADARQGLRPCAIVATTGTTSATAPDPLTDIGRLARAHGLWLHVDAAMAGSAMILPECRWMWQGIEQADSLVVNPHKWLGAAFDCSLYFVRDPAHLVRTMSVERSYLQSAVDGGVINYRDWGVPLGRRFRALKLWFLIREQGVAALQARLRRDIGHARRLAELVKDAPGWRLVAPVPLQTVCLRHEPEGYDAAAQDRHNRRLAAAINASGKAFVTPAILDERWMIRVSIGALTTEWHHVQDLWHLLCQQADRLLREADD